MVNCMHWSIAKGLLDADDEDDLRAKLLSLKEVWNSNEQQYLPEGKAPKFYEYINEKVGFIF